MIICWINLGICWTNLITQTVERVKAVLIALSHLLFSPFGIHLINRAKPLSTDPKDMQIIAIRCCWAYTTLLLIANPGLTKEENKA